VSSPASSVSCCMPRATAVVVCTLSDDTRVHAEATPVGAGQLRADRGRGRGEAGGRVHGLRRHALPHRRRPRQGLHDWRGE
jgi:hypothetical protein